MQGRLTDFSVLTFDCYGTLIDWERGIWDALQPLLHRADMAPIASPGKFTRQATLQAFAETESAQQAATPAMLYPDLLTEVHRTLAQRFRLPTEPELDRSFGESVSHWPAFPDSADALRILKRYFKLVILSNVNRDGFAASNRKLGVTFDAVYTAQDVGSYKPNSANFDHMLAGVKSEFGLEAGAILHTAQSLFHDHLPAKAAGLASAWIDRQGLKENDNWGATARVAERPAVDFSFSSLGEMAQRVEGASPTST